jgi:iron(III) transport system substrate-binding protein
MESGGSRISVELSPDADRCGDPRLPDGSNERNNSVQRKRIIALAGALALTAALAGTANAAAAKPKLNGTCTKAGQTATAGTQSLLCTKVGKKLVWRAAAATAATSAITAAPTTTAAPSKAQQWQNVVAAAKKEGKVTIYSGQALDNLNDLGARFKKAYGIDVEVVRLVDADIQAKLTAEADTKKPIADVAVLSAVTLVNQNDAAGWYVPATGPSFDDPAFNKTALIANKGNLFVSSAAILTFGWNTQLYSKGMKDFDGALDPALSGGKLGVADVTLSPTLVDYYLYLEDRFGPSFLARVAQQKPRIYGSALTTSAAIGSGEIYAAMYTTDQRSRKAQGIPVDSGLADELWGARFLTGVMKSAPHPNAAQVLADFMVTKDGQTAIAKDSGAVLADTPGAIALAAKVRPQNVAKLTPEFVKDYNEKWNILFR